MQTNLGLYVESRSIDDDDFCQLQLHRIKYFQDPDPRTVQDSKKRLKVYEVKSVRAIGRYFSIFTIGGHKKIYKFFTKGK